MKKLLLILFLCSTVFAKKTIIIETSDDAIITITESAPAIPDPLILDRIHKGIGSDFVHKSWSPDRLALTDHDEYVRIFKPVAGTYRPMSWSNVNSDFADYPSLTNTTRLLQQIKLANAMESDFWFNLPYYASQKFTREAVSLIRANLNSDLKIIVEWSNEAWNTGLGTYKEIMKVSGENAAHNDFMTEWALRINMTFTGAREADSECILVLGAHPENVWLTNKIHERLMPYDAVATTFYIGNDRKVKNNQNVHDARSLIQAAENRWFAKGEKKMEELFAWADGKDLEVFGYEGGDHLVAPIVTREDKITFNISDAAGEPWSKIVPFVIEAQSEPGLLTLMDLSYNKFVKLGGTRACFFNTLSLRNKWGAWGMGKSLNTVEQDISYQWWLAK